MVYMYTVCTHCCTHAYRQQWQLLTSLQLITCVVVWLIKAAIISNK